MSKITTNYLTLEFYAVRYNLRVEDLSWAILEISDDCECWRHPALKIKGAEAYIDITEDKYVRFDTFLHFREYVFLDAKLRGSKLIHVDKSDSFENSIYTLIIDMKDAVGYYYRHSTFDSPNFKPYNLSLDKSIGDNLAAFLEEERAFEFFANRFWITKEQLSWGVLETIIGEKTWRTPVLRVADSRSFIYLYSGYRIAGMIGCCHNIGGRIMTTYPAYLERGELYYEKKKGDGFNHNISLDINEILREMFFDYLQSGGVKEEY